MSLCVRLILCLVGFLHLILSNCSTNLNPYVFDTRGRLSQVDAAYKASSKGGTVLAIKGAESLVVFTCSQRESSGSLMTKLTPNRPSSFCHSISYIASGIAADSQYLANKMFGKVSNHMYLFGTDPSIYRLSKEAADLIHTRTMTNERPLGIKAIFCGHDKQGQLALIEIDPIGNLYDCKVSCLGPMATKILEFFDKSQDVLNLNTDEVIKCGLESLRRAVHDMQDERCNLHFSEVGLAIHTSSHGTWHADECVLKILIENDNHEAVSRAMLAYFSSTSEG